MMSRLYISHDLDFGQYNLWQGNAKRAINGRKGQKFLRELERALLEMPEQHLITGSFCKDGKVCLLGAAAVQRLIDGGMSREEALIAVEQKFRMDYEDDDAAFLGKKHLGLTFVLAWELAYLNDGDQYCDLRGTWTPEVRWQKCLEWVRERIKS